MDQQDLGSWACRSRARRLTCSARWSSANGAKPNPYLSAGLRASPACGSAALRGHQV